MTHLSIGTILIIYMQVYFVVLQQLLLHHGLVERRAVLFLHINYTLTLHIFSYLIITYIYIYTEWRSKFVLSGKQNFN